MEYKIALAGNPNCGKTTMFNDLTGSSQYVGNWPGVTVEKKRRKAQSKQAGNHSGFTRHLLPFPIHIGGGCQQKLSGHPAS